MNLTSGDSYIRQIFIENGVTSTMYLRYASGSDWYKSTNASTFHWQRIETVGG